MMTKSLVLVSLLLVNASIVVAQQSEKPVVQQNPDFSGTWIPEVEKERKPKASSKEWTNVIIEQHDPELKFTLIHPNPDGKTARKLEFTYYTDGRGETNNGTVYYFVMTNNSLAYDTINSTTKWDGKTLIVVHRMAMRQGQATITSDLIMRWKLSDDGKTLVRTTKQANFSATYKLPSGEEKPLTVSLGGKAEEEFTDKYIWLGREK